MKHLFLSLFILGSGLLLTAQEFSKYIVVDQFGYLPDSRKVAVLRNPARGFDADESFDAGSWYSVVSVPNGEIVYRGEAQSWSSGALDASSGDQAKHFDFSPVTETGLYYVYDEELDLRSYEFVIAPNVYNEVLKQAMRTFFYQRVGFEKKLPYAETGWEDEASHSLDGQDNNCRSWYDKNNPDSERDVSGGWYDAGDYNKYTNWNANYVTEFMLAYLEKPGAWSDDYQIPESGDGIPDILNEAMYGLDHLLRMQQEDGSVLSIVGESGASPPSAATQPSFYGPPNTSATRNTAAAFALASGVYRGIGLVDYADTLVNRALMAWDWAEVYPDSLFRNNDSGYGSSGLGAGQQETDDYGREMMKLEAACFLFEATGDVKFRDYFDAHYRETHFFQWSGHAYPFEGATQDLLLYYAGLEGATPSVSEEILSTYASAIKNNANNLMAYQKQRDPYLAHIKDYTWGSNGIKAVQGSMNYNLLLYDIAGEDAEDAWNASEAFIHYLHGVNPLNLVYLSNMYAHGAENCVNEFYHTWFTNGSPLWDRVGESEFGPAPGFLTGGPNPSYDWDGCCPSGCGSSGNNAKCMAESITPPKGQPSQKSYKDFNTSWPLNSWSVTENSCGYQLRYVRLLSKFVTAGADCSGEVGGEAFIDSCGICAGGSTGIEPSLDPESCGGLPDAEGDTMFIEGRHLYTAAGENVVLRGVNEMFIWGTPDPDGSRNLPEIDQTGANCVRLVWSEEFGQKNKLVELIENTISRKMIAMPECHSATGEWDKLDICINFWKDPGLLEGVQRNKKWTLVNIGNEVGDGSVTAEAFRAGYMRAIDSLRLWGYTVPLVIDASTWGQNIQVIFDTWEDLQAHDPLHNILFSVHSYWSDTDNYSRVASEAINKKLPVIIGEGPSPTAYPACEILDYSEGMNVFGRNGLGWLSWSWGGNPNGHCVPNFDHTDGGIFGNWRTIYGEDMMADHEYSLMATAERPPSFYEDGVVKASGIYIKSNSAFIPRGDSVLLQVMVMPVNAANRDYLIEFEGNEGLVYYNPESGYLSGLQEGKVMLTLSLEANPLLKYTREITVEELPVNSIEFTPASVSLEPGELMTFILEILPENAYDKSFSYHISDMASAISFDSAKQEITAVNPGTALVEARWSGGDVTGRLEVTVTDPLSLEPKGGIPDLRIYPNPANTSLYIEFPSEQDISLRLLDMKGRLVGQARHREKTEMDISSLPPGTYFLLLPLKDEIYRRKVMVL